MILNHGVDSPEVVSFELEDDELLEKCSDKKYKVIRTCQIKIGNIYCVSGNLYILAQVDIRLCTLICLKEGSRWGKPVKVEDLEKITTKEFKELLSTEKANYIQILKSKKTYRDVFR